MILFPVFFFELLSFDQRIAIESQGNREKKLWTGKLAPSPLRPSGR
jgi:hypothetical protein